jgi:hypothetical protein
MKRLALISLLFATTTFAAPRVVGVVEPEAAIGRTLTLKVDGDYGPCSSLILFIQRSPMLGLIPRCGNGTVAFDLAVNEKNARRWHQILGGRWVRVVSVGLGPNDQFPFDSVVTEEPFRVIQPWRFAFVVLLAIAMIAAVIVVRRKSPAQIQGAIWLAVITLGYAHIWSVTGESETITAGALAMLAIDGGASIASTWRKGDRRRHLSTIQHAAWMSVLTVIFIATVVRFLEMPDFSGNILALAGISGGAYVALE